MRAFTRFVMISMLSTAQLSSHAQSVNVGTPTSSQNGSTTTVTIPVTVSSGSSTSTSTSASNLAFLDVTLGAGDGISGVQTISESFTTVKLSKVVADTANGWNASSYIYTVPTSGTYLVISKIRITDSTAPGMQYGQGVSTSNVDGPYFMWSTTVGVRNYLQNSRLMTLNKGDQIRMFGYVAYVTGARLNSAELSIQQVQ